jgi:tRNA (mo5U34)-methyltransferase
MSGPPKGAGFRLLAELLGSKVDWRVCNIYDINPDDLGMFDVVVCGTLLIHLQSPVKALEAVRSVTRGQFFSSEQIEVWLSIMGRGKPLAKLRGTGRTCQWWLYNGACHEQMLYSAGFKTVERSKYFINHLGPSHPKAKWGPKTAPTLLAKRALTKDPQQGVLHRAVLAENRL